ncbi:IS30 family transposase [Lactobacillus equicursoris]|uniref:IS30 family transposase n=1 Tax=Lactobacillus equicursoris TaxID=420645 RepID=A0A844FLL3_9LACO|nr:IS30 family transposase [Lactobacillus equicursoris]MST79257.1 IS30 family transposase [Lactobacillus equicursoris]
MDHSYSNTKLHQKGKHLSKDDRITIQVMHSIGCSNRAIARELNCSPSTIGYELKRGTVSLYTGNVKRYKAVKGQMTYERHRRECGRKSLFLRRSKFINYVSHCFHKRGWSLDACVGYALAEGIFPKDQVVSTKTLYNYVDLGLMDIKNIDLPEKVKRNTKARRARANKRILGRSIDERSPRIDTRKDFGHWECDLVLGHKTKDDDVLLTLCERKTRRFFMIKIEDKTSASVMKAFDKLREFYGSKWNRIFKSITTDNGSEFADLSNLEQVSKTLVYYAHPYTSCDKGSVERHNGLIRRYIPKGDRMDKYNVEDITKIEVWCNSLPRKILNYKTPEECFDIELDHIYRHR